MDPVFTLCSFKGNKKLKTEHTGKFLINKLVRAVGSKLICLQLFKITAVSLVPAFRKLSKKVSD